MSEKNVELVRRIYERWDREESVRGLVAEDIEYVNPDYAVEPGTRTGRSAFRSVRETYPNFTVHVDRYVDAGDQVVVIARYTASGDASGVELEGEHGYVWTVKDGLAVRFQWFQSHSEALEAAGVPRMATVSYTRMADMTEADLRLINADADDDAAQLPGRLMDAVAQLEQFQGALQVTRLEHSLQCATRAHRAGKDKEYVAAALLHDIGDALAPHSHGEMVGAVLRPFVSERVCWIVQKHALFQAYYYAHLMGEDRNARDKYRDHPYYDDCVEFCEHFDQNCFDPDYDSLPLEFFRPIVEEVFSRPRFAADELPA